MATLFILKIYSSKTFGKNCVSACVVNILEKNNFAFTGKFIAFKGNKEMSYIALTIVHIADIEPPKIVEISKLIKIAKAAANVVDVVAASSLACTPGSIYSN